MMIDVSSYLCYSRKRNDDDNDEVTMMAVSNYIGYDLEIDEDADDARYVVESTAQDAYADVDVEVVNTVTRNGEYTTTVHVSGHFIEMSKFSSRWNRDY